MFLKNWPNPASFSVYFRLFNMIQIDKSIDGVLGIRTRGGRMEGVDESTELRVDVCFNHDLQRVTYHTWYSLHTRLKCIHDIVHPIFHQMNLSATVQQSLFSFHKKTPM